MKIFKKRQLSMKTQFFIKSLLVNLSLIHIFSYEDNLKNSLELLRQGTSEK